MGRTKEMTREALLALEQKLLDRCVKYGYDSEEYDGLTGRAVEACLRQLRDQR